jgi:hypothetical protein
MISTPTILRSEFERDDFDQMCLFTGAPVKQTSKGEHVIPQWLIDDYELNHKKIKLGLPGGEADMSQFRTRADPTANGDFGVLEDKVKRGVCSHDELHLWQKKISAGMTLCHWRMAKNKHHPKAPGNFDSRYLLIALNDFRSDYEKFALKQPVPREGSTLVLPTKVPGGWLAHVFGATTVEGDENDAILPFGMLAVSHNSKLIVSVFNDSSQEFESSQLATEWTAKNLDTCSDAPKVAAALAITYSEFVFNARREILKTEGHGFDELCKGIATQFGLDIDPKTRRYQVSKEISSA